MATPVDEFLPVRPRKASAGRRRRHQTQLAYQLRKVAPGAVRILLNPFWSDAHGPSERVFLATARDSAGDRIKLPPGGSRAIASLLQGAYPGADYDQPQTWRAGLDGLTCWSDRQVA